MKFFPLNLIFTAAVQIFDPVLIQDNFSFLDNFEFSQSIKIIGHH